MNDIERPDIFDSAHNLIDNYPCLLLPNVLFNFQQDAKIVPISILLHHVNIGACLDRLMKPDRVLASHHAMDAYLLVNAVKVVLADVGDLDDLTCIDLL